MPQVGFLERAIRHWIELRTFWPLVPGVSAHELAAHLWIESRPKSGKIGRGLHSSLVRCEQMYYQRGTVGSNTRSVSHSEEVLKARCYPRGLVTTVMNFGLTPVLQPNAHWSEFPEKVCIRLLLQKKNEVLRRRLQIGKASKSRT
jgi:hypothetical protein